MCMRMYGCLRAGLFMTVDMVPVVNFYCWLIVACNVLAHFILIMHKPAAKSVPLEP